MFRTELNRTELQVIMKVRWASWANRDPLGPLHLRSEARADLLRSLLCSFQHFHHHCLTLTSIPFLNRSLLVSLLSTESVSFGVKTGYYSWGFVRFSVPKNLRLVITWWWKAMTYLANCLLLFLLRDTGHSILAHQALSRRVTSPSTAPQPHDI